MHKALRAFRAYLGVIEGVREPLRCFGDEISVERLALARFPFGALASRLALLRNPGGGDRYRRAAH